MEQMLINFVRACFCLCAVGLFGAGFALIFGLFSWPQSAETFGYGGILFCLSVISALGCVLLQD